MNGYDVNLLMQNLNDMVNMKLHDSYLLNEELKGLDLPDLDIPELLPASNVNSSVPISFLVNNVITFNTKLSSFKLGGIHDKYLKIFYYDCLDSIAPFFQNQGNPLRDILLSFAKNEAYLLSSILATGASIAYRKSNNLEDERNYCAYLSHCLSLLGEQFKNESNVLNRIEPIILTVIMLAWDCIYSMNSQWRSHLKGVTDLFKKINAGNSSKVLNVAKCWFKVMETFASISTVFGGSLIDNNDLDAIFDPYDYQYVDSLKFLNIMTPLNEFNLLRGHKEDFDLVIKEVFKSLNTIRSTEKNYFSKEEGLFTKKLDYLLLSSQTSSEKSKDQISYFNTQKILVEIDKQLDYEFIDKSGIIPSDNQSHPRISNIHDNAIDMVTLKNGEEVAISWYAKRVKYHSTSGLNAMDEETRAIVKRYYKINGGKFQRLTEHNLNRLEKVWYGKNQNYRLEEQDVLTW
ncbi:AEL_collapsed_G0009040.mRNA.1.CDS.1 [Saccharomyces cerevisiae]|nr:AEL_collapsed_G0009040.mRNA.1.CDS.1 [Saccharomyces cerevisiae]